MALPRHRGLDHLERRQVPGQGLDTVLRERRHERMCQCDISQPTVGDHMPKGSPKIKGSRKVNMASGNECRPNA